MANVNYLGYNPTPPALEVNRYNDSKARNNHNNNFSEILAAQKNLLLQKAYGSSSSPEVQTNPSLQGAPASWQSHASRVTPHEIATVSSRPRNDGL